MFAGDKMSSLRVGENSNPETVRLVVSEEERQIKSHRSIGTDLKTQELFTINIRNIPERMKKSGVENICGKFGKVVDIYVHYQVCKLNPHLYCIAIVYFYSYHMALTDLVFRAQS